MKPYQGRNLRLAARVIAEWKTPRTSPEYREILMELLRAHPFAKGLGLSVNHEIFSSDENGILLWYLSETLFEKSNLAEKPTRKKPRTRAPVASPQQISANLLELLLSTHIGPSDERLWEGGPLKSQIIGMIWREMELNDSLAQKALISVSLPTGLSLRADIRKRYIRPLLGGKKIGWTLLAGMSRRISTVSMVFARAGFLFVLVAIGLLIRLLLLAKDEYSVQPLWIHGMQIAICLVVACLLLFIASLFQYDWFLQLFSASLRKELRLRQVKGQTGKLDRWVLKSISEFGSMCASDTDMLPSLTRDEPDSAWFAYALSDTLPLSASVLRSSIRLLRNAEVDEDLKLRLLERFLRADSLAAIPQ